jgi:hypothetical protein
MQNTTNDIDFEFYRKIYENEQYDIAKFYPDEIDAIRSYPDYVQDGTVKDSIDMLVDFSKIGQAEYTFNTPGLTEQFKAMRANSDFDEKVEYMLRDLHVYGNAYFQVVKEDGEVMVYTPQPDHCYAEYDQYNTQKRAKYVGVKIEVKKDKKKYILDFRYLPGEIVLVAKGTDGNKVNPLDVFSEVLEDKDVLVRTIDEEEEYYINTGATYPLLQIARLNKPANRFYGRSVITGAVSSKVAYINRLTMLERHAIYISANPKLQLSRKTVAAIIDSIQELVNSNTQFKEYFETEATVVKSAFSTSWMKSAIASNVNKELTFFEDDGQGENKYIVNSYSLEDLRLARSRAIEAVRSDLKISPALTDVGVATGAKSGIAYKRLMQKTINHVENLQKTMTPHLQRLAITMLELENETQYTELPTIEYPPIIEDEEANQRLNRLTQRLTE